MAQLRDNNPIQANGDYDFTIQNAQGAKKSKLAIGLRLSGMAGSGDQVDIKELVGETNWETIYTFDEDGGIEVECSSNKIRLTVTGYTNPIRFNLATESEVIGIS